MDDRNKLIEKLGELSAKAYMFGRMYHIDEVTDLTKDINELIAKVFGYSPWHTGTPTEDGLYAVYYLNDNNPTGEEYETLCDMFVSPVFNDGCVERWVNYNRCLVFDADEIVRWQKIEPFVEATE